MSNTTVEILSKRLLRLFSVKTLRDEFGISRSSVNDIVDDIVATNTEAEIKSFVFANFNLTKQHIYVYKLDKVFNVRLFDRNATPYDIEHLVSIANGISFYCLPLITHDVYLNNPFVRDVIEFYQPLKVTLQRDTLTFQFTILEKNVSSYFQSGRFIKSERRLEEETIKGDFLSLFSLQYVLSVCDLNKGIKHLWETDVVDSKYVKYKKAKSMATEAMDEDETYKRTYPEDYIEMMKTPLSRTVIKYLKQDDELCDLFTIDPSGGEISFSKFPANVNQVQNVIDEILSNN